MTTATDPDEKAADGAFTRENLLKRSRRGFGVIRHSFVQKPAGAGPRPGMLAKLVKARSLRTLHAYLFVCALTTKEDGITGRWTTTHPLQVWARALGIERTTSKGRAADSATTKTFRRLVDLKLINRSVIGSERKVQIELLAEDGSGATYERPKSAFLKVRDEVWLDGWFLKLDLPATAMLLVALKEEPGFVLPTENVPSWYGWSADTAERGFATLRDEGLLTVTTRRRRDAFARHGITRVNYYELTPTLRPPVPGVHPKLASAPSPLPPPPPPASPTP